VAGTRSDRLSGFENARGGAADDVIYGSEGANRLEGGGYDDWLKGYGGNDRLDGGDAMDFLVGGSGRDLLTGGGDLDTFRFEKVSDSGTLSTTRDEILDFQDGVDRIDVAAIDAKAGTMANDAFHFLGSNKAFSGQSGELRVVFTGAGELVQGDVNGDRAADFSFLVRDVTHSIGFSVDDFLL
jgi:Ca2+-binding RTX toxin-like protein